MAEIAAHLSASQPAILDSAEPPHRAGVVLAVFAHPDDESFRAGGTLSMLARRGVRVYVLTATRGEAGTCGDPPLCTPEELPAVRESELRCACAALGIEPPRLLDYRDGTLAHVNEKEAVTGVLAIMRELQPQALLTWPPDGLSGHPDHIAVSRWTSEALDRMAGPAAEAAGPSPHTIALYHIVVPQSLAQTLGMTQLHAVPDESVTLSVDVSQVWEAKMAAIHCHRTQLTGTPILSAPEEKQRLFLAVEHFRLARGQSDPLSWLGQDIVSRGKDNNA